MLLGEKFCRKRRGGIENRRHPVTEALRSMKIIGLEMSEAALIEIARIGRAHYLEAKEGGGLLGLPRHEQHGQRGRKLAAEIIQHARPHAGGGAPAVGTHGDLPYSTLPSDEVVTLCRDFGLFTRSVRAHGGPDTA